MDCTNRFFYIRLKKIKIFLSLQPLEIVLFIRCFIEKITENFAGKTKKQHFCNAFSKYDGIYLLKEDKRLFFFRPLLLGKEQTKKI